MATFGAVDIGSNSVRLKIARLVRQRFVVIHEDREVTRLGESVFRTGLLDPQAMAGTIKALRRFQRACQRYGADMVRVVATSALRDARNPAAFVDWVRLVTGWKVEIITGLEEGRLIHLGVMSGTRLSARRVLLIDLGGGSCELTFSVGGQIQRMVSLPLGAVRLTQEFLRHDPPKQKELQRLRAYIDEEIERVERKLLGSRVQATIATSGTAAALANLVGKRRGGMAKRSPGVVSAAAVRKIAEKIASYGIEKRRGLRGIGPRRAEIIIPGAAVFAGLMTHGITGFRYSPLGLRDGLVAQMAADLGQEKHIQKRIQSQRHAALVTIGKHYGVEARYAAKVRDLAVALFGGLRPLHQLPPEYEEWLTAAAMLHEVGFYINRTGRHRHAYYIVANSEIFGYTAEQRRIIAAICRYVGNSRPTPQNRQLRILRAEDRERVPKAIVLLRLARALDQGRRGAVKNVSARAQDGRVTLALRARPSPDLELWALEKERSYFRSVFGRELVARVAS